MATLRDFMAQVVPWPNDGPGYVNLHWTSPKGPGLRGKPFRDLDAFVDFALAAATKPAYYKDVWFCLSQQSTAGEIKNGWRRAIRTQQCATHLKAIWLDVDVKANSEKHYGSTAEGLAALAAFILEAVLPPPSAIVFSGSGGFHVYWISDKALTQEEWRPYAEGLKAAAIKHGLKCDAGLTTDAARVLRVPGTFNYKGGTPRAVRLAHLGESLDFAGRLAGTRCGVPDRYKVVTGAVAVPAWATGKKMAAVFVGLDPKADRLTAGHDDTPLDPTTIFKNCIHYKDALATQGKEHPEPLWNLTLLGATWFEDGRTWAHKLSEGHPDYNKESTDDKFNQKLARRAQGTGWPSCNAFESAGAGCIKCPFHGRVRSPLNLAERVPTSDALDHTPPPPEDLMLPDGYTVDPTTGWICKIVTRALAGGFTSNELRPLFMCRIRNPILQRGNRKILFETSLDGDAWGPVSVLETDLTTEQTLVKTLRTHGCKPYPDNQKFLVQFMTSFTAKLDLAKQRINTVSFGWLRKEEGGQEPIGFAYGGRVVLANGSEQVAGFSDKTVEASYKPKGSEEPWWELHRIITAQVHPSLEVISAAGFGAPLMYATNQYSAVLAPWSPESGAHKSTSIASGCSIWASPVMVKERPMSSQKGVMRMMAHIRNLPVFLDEISEVAHMDEVRTMVNYLSEGADGSKLHQDRTLYAKESWQTLIVVGSNQSLCENIIRNIQYTDAKLQRVFEFIVTPRPDSADPNHVASLVNSLDHNYGGVGLLYSRLLGRDPAGISRYVKSVHDRFNKEVGHVSAERMRSAAAVATFAGAELANTLGCSFHLEEMWSYLKEQYFVQRDRTKSANTIGGTAENTLDMFTQFIKGNVQNILVVQTMPVKRKGHPAPITYVSGPTRDRPYAVHVRFSQTERVIEVSRKKLESWLAHGKTVPGPVISGLKNHFKATETVGVDLAAGSGVAGGREKIISIPVPAGSPFEGVLLTNATAEDVLGKPNGKITAKVTAPAADGEQLALDLPLPAQIERTH